MVTQRNQNAPGGYNLFLLHIVYFHHGTQKGEYTYAAGTKQHTNERMHARTGNLSHSHVFLSHAIFIHSSSLPNSEQSSPVSSSTSPLQ